MAAQGTDKEAAWVGGRDFIPHTNPQELTTAPTMMHDEIALPALRLILGDYSGANFKATNTLRKACSRSGLHAEVWYAIATDATLPSYFHQAGGSIDIPSTSGLGTAKPVAEPV